LDTNRLNRWLTLGANIGVLIGIAFVAIEIRQNTEMTRAQITQSRAEVAIAISDLGVNSDYLPEIMIKIRNDSEITEAEEFRYHAYLRAILRNQDNYLQQYYRGLLPDHIPGAVAATIRANLVGNPRGRKYWETRKNRFTYEFVAFVEAVIAESEFGASQ